MKRAHGFDGPLTIPSRPSRILLLLGTAAHAGAVGALLIAGIPAWLCAVLTVAVACNLLLFIRRQYLRPRRAPDRALQLSAGNEWRLMEGDGEIAALIPEPWAFVHPLLVVLPFVSAAGDRHVFVLLPDNADRDTLRRLRVRLRYGGASATVA